MASFIPLSVPNFQGNEKEYVNEAVVSEWVSTGGSKVADFEKMVACTEWVISNDNELVPDLRLVLLALLLKKPLNGDPCALGSAVGILLRIAPGFCGLHAPPATL